MSTIKTDRKDLEILLNSISTLNSDAVIEAPPEASPSAKIPESLLSKPSPPKQQVKSPAPTPNAVVDPGGDSPFNTEVRLFDFNIDSIKKGLRKKARRTVMSMAKHILPDDLMEREYIEDKMEQDTDTLADLYVQIECNKIMQASLIDAVSRGQGGPRSYEVFGQLTDKIAGLNKQALSTEQTIRKTYIDLKFEIRDKDTESNFNPSTAIAAGHPSPQLPDNSVIITSSKDLNNLAKQRHREMIEKAEKAKETQYVES